MSTSEFSQSIYDQLRPLLDAAWQQFRRDGRERQFPAWARLRIGTALRPYIRQFYLDLLAAQQQPNTEQRQAMIAETAWLLAERSGFSGDSDHYWRQAEQQVAQRLARQAHTDKGEGNA